MSADAADWTLARRDGVALEDPDGQVFRLDLADIERRARQGRRLALARPDVAFTVTHNRKPVMSVPSADDEKARLARVGKICGEAFASQALYIYRESDSVALSGWIGLPTFNRSQPDMQFWFVNGRSIADKTLAHAVRHAYRDVLFHGRFPGCYRLGGYCPHA